MRSSSGPPPAASPPSIVPQGLLLGFAAMRVDFGVLLRQRVGACDEEQRSRDQGAAYTLEARCHLDDWPPEGWRVSPEKAGQLSSRVRSRVRSAVVPSDLDLLRQMHSCILCMDLDD